MQLRRRFCLIFQVDVQAQKLIAGHMLTTLKAFMHWPCWFYNCSDVIKYTVWRNETWRPATLHTLREVGDRVAQHRCRALTDFWRNTKARKICLVHTKHLKIRFAALHQSKPLRWSNSCDATLHAKHVSDTKGDSFSATFKNTTAKCLTT